ncbi:hypothetical protein [Spongiibacter tropicus]|uniref:hypothetical protein n=1 Tax=Spongiibacter tropicus TaxID=454602 RepID=UPI0003B50B53|nr:hypothetical protein [Spongiibacter tropicus]
MSQPLPLPQQRRGELITLTGTAKEIEQQLALMECNCQLVSAIYTRKNGQHTTKVYAEVMQ